MSTRTRSVVRSISTLEIPARSMPRWSILRIATCCASSAGRQRIRSTPRRALRGVTRAYPALALASMSFLQLAPAAPVVLDVAAEGPRGSELAELVAHHRLGDEPRDVLPAVMDR